MRFIIAFSILFSTNSYASGGVFKQGTYEHTTDWKALYKEQGFDKKKCDVQIKNTVKVSGILDGKGKVYCWRGKGYPKKCHAPEEISENEPRMFEMMPGSKIKNMFIECALDGIHMNDDTEISNVVFMDVEEDAITTKGKGNVIRNNKFYLCQDKCVQMNKASDVLIEGNYVQDSLRGFSGSGKSAGGAKGIVIRGNRGKNVEIFIRAQRNHEIKASKNNLNGGRALVEIVEKAKVQDCGGNTVGGGADLYSKKTEREMEKCK